MTIIKPVPVPAKGPVHKLKINIATEHVKVYIRQTIWPRQKQNPNWRIEVTGIDGRYSIEMRNRIERACEETARIFLRRWLYGVAPLHTLETVTWPELVSFATRKKFNVMSPSEKRYKARRGRARYPISSEIEYQHDTDVDEEEDA